MLSLNHNSLKSYMTEVGKYPLLTSNEERDLTQTFHATKDSEIAKKLVLSNLRLVIHIAMQYRKSYENLLDLIQEGNVGLMMAVKNYNPYKGSKLSSYASIWIKSYILKYVRNNFHLVKIATTKDQIKLYYNLNKERERLLNLGKNPTSKLIAYNLNVSEASVESMQKRMALGSEVELDNNLFIEDFVDRLAEKQEVDLLKANLAKFSLGLNKREQVILKERLLSELPLTLRVLADEFGISKQRVNIVEKNLKEKLRLYMAKYIR